MSTRTNFPERIKARREQAEARKAETDKLTPQQRLERLRTQGHGHSKEAKKLEAQISKAS